MGRHRQVEDPSSQQQSSPEVLTHTGYHRAMGKQATRRRIAAWPVVCMTLVVLTILGWLGWNWANGMVANRAEAQAAQCQEGNATVKVAVDPSAEKPVSEAAVKWNKDNTIVRSHCIQIDIKPVASAKMVDALSGKQDVSAVGGLPAGWIPQASPEIQQLTADRPELIAASSESITQGPVNYLYLGLAGDGIDLVQKQAAQLFRDFLKQPAQQASFSAPTPASTP
jgi:hypothetical protein